MTAQSKNKHFLTTLAFIAPALVFYVLFMVIPLLGGISYSFTDWNGLNRKFNVIGIANYLQIFAEDKDFLKACVFTFKYVVIMVMFQNLIALFLAVLVESRSRSKSLFRTVFFLPNMISLIIGSLMWTFIFSKVLPELGTVSFLKFLDQSWIGNPDISFYSIIIVSLWAGVGYMMVIYIAALQGVPKELKEAAIIDGASPVKMFFRVTLPLIYHAVTICIFLTLNSSVKVFDVVYGLTRGGPGRETEVITLNIYQEAFTSNMRYGYASAKAIVLFLMILVITLIQIGVMKRKEVEQ